MRAIVLAALTLLIAPASYAVVDMKNANFADTWTDMEVPGSGYDLRIQRTYNSRSLFDGLFGFGWCSDFETKLTVTPENTLDVTECGGGLKVNYTAKNHSPGKVDETITKIVSEVKKRNPGQSNKYFQDLAKELKSNELLRDEFSRQLKLSGKVVAGKTYYANGREVERIVLKAGVYTRFMPDGTYQKFNREGFLTYMHDRNGNYLRVIYNPDSTIKAVTDNSGRQLNFTYHKHNSKVKKVTGPNGLSATYKYDGDDLTEIVNAWKNKFAYKYDDLHNLTQIKFPDKTDKRITYNKDRDWVTSFKNRAGCIETYDYQVDKENPTDHYWSTVIKKCEKKVTNRSTYEFFHRKRKNGGKYLYRVRTDNNGNVSDIVYHPELGKPLSIRRNKDTVLYSYYPNGLIKTKQEPLRKMKFEYENKCTKISKLLTAYYSPENESRVTASKKNSKKKNEDKPIKVVTTLFKYDSPKCNLIQAKNSDGQFARLSYDAKGRISVIKDQSKKIVKIKYEERFGKPAFVTRPGLGAIKVKYKPDGTIAEVTSKDGPTVAVQVASIFNNLLDLIAPATAETPL